MDNTELLSKRDRMVAIVKICRDKAYSANELIEILIEDYEFTQSPQLIYSDLKFLVIENVIERTGIQASTRYKTIINDEFIPENYPGIFKSAPLGRPSTKQLTIKEREYIPTFNPPRSPLINKLFGLAA